MRAILDAPCIKEGEGKELRRLHDTANQHLRALKAMKYDPSGPFITSILESKLDTTTMFEWQKYSQESAEVPHYTTLLKFLCLRAQASESSVPDLMKKSNKSESNPRNPSSQHRQHASFSTSYSDCCVVCKVDKHPLYACPKFKCMTHDRMIATLKAHHLCFNCLKIGHFLKDCGSTQRCKRCQKPHHTILHLEQNPGDPPPPASTAGNQRSEQSHAAQARSKSFSTLLMTCSVQVTSPHGGSIQARALLDSASSTSFVSERLVQCIRLPRSRELTQVTGIGGLPCQSHTQSVVHFSISSPCSPGKSVEVDAVVLPQVTCELPTHPIMFDPSWTHLADVHLSDPKFGSPGRVDVLLGVDVFCEVLLQGRRIGPPGTPMAFETSLGWVLAGSAQPPGLHNLIVSHHTHLLQCDDLLQKFWELEECNFRHPVLSPEEKLVVKHFQETHRRDENGKFVVPLPWKSDAKPLGESRTQAVRRFCSLERSLRTKGQFKEFSDVINEYLEMGHAELVPTEDLEKSRERVFYLPMHAVLKHSSTTTKIRAVFDASAKTSSGYSLNDGLLVGPTVHSSLIDVLLRFRLHHIALTTDVSRMYRAVCLTAEERDYHRFVWRKELSDLLVDYRMTRVTFGVSSSSFTANMCVVQNAMDYGHDYPLAASAVHNSFYVDDGLTGADTVRQAMELQTQLQRLFSKAGFLLRKWRSSDPAVLQHLPPELRDDHPSRTLPESDGFSKALGVEWNSDLDCFRLAVTDFPCLDVLTKRALVSDISKTFDVLGWFSPCIVTVKILLQRVWEDKIGWDDAVSPEIRETWERWRMELGLLSKKLIPRCYFIKEATVTSVQLHGFCDASEDAYAGVTCLRIVDSTQAIHTSLIASKTKVSPIKRLSIPRLELCGAHLLTDLLHHVKEVLCIACCDIFAWTDSTIVLNWLIGNPRRFKTYVGNRVSHIMELLPPDRWHHVRGMENPADCASRGLFPSELLTHDLWWYGPKWLCSSQSQWPSQSDLEETRVLAEEKEICAYTFVMESSPLFAITNYSSFIRLKRVTAWLLRFIHNCKLLKEHGNLALGFLSVQELSRAEECWLRLTQQSSFPDVFSHLGKHQELPKGHKLVSLRPFLDSSGLLRVGGRMSEAKLPYSRHHPVILPSHHSVTKLIVHSEHLRLLHAGPTLVLASLSFRFHIIGSRKTVRSITRSCVVCRRVSARPLPQVLGQIPIDRITPGSVFDRIGVDYAGPILVKSGSIRKPICVKAYVCVFVSFSVRAVHLELVSDLTSEAFLAALRRFIGRRGKPIVIWSDNGSNFIGAARELKELAQFLQDLKTQKVISEFCSAQSIQWKFIPERSPHFGGLWEAAVKSFKYHLKRIVGEVKLNFEELTTVLVQIESCLNSRPLIPLDNDHDSPEVLTPGHFLIGRPLESLPDPARSFHSLSLLRRWHLCQALVRHFWQRWSSEYLVQFRKLTKWQFKSRNFQVGDIVILQESGLVPTRWPLARIVEVHPGSDGNVRVVTVKTANGCYKRPITKLALILSIDHD